MTDHIIREAALLRQFGQEVEARIREKRWEDEQDKQNVADEYDQQRAEQHDADMHDAEEQQRNDMMMKLHSEMAHNQGEIMRMQMEEASEIRNSSWLILDVQKKMMADISEHQQQIKHLTETITEQNSRTSDLQNQLIEVWEKCRDMEEEKEAVWKKCRDLLEEKEAVEKKCRRRRRSGRNTRSSPSASC